MSAVIESKPISVEEYLQQELTGEVKHELIDGHVYAMTGASANHNRLSTNVLIEFKSHLKNSPCEAFGPDLKLRINSNFFYPDVMVVCHFDEAEPYFTSAPVIIVEVLSKTTRKTDKTTKLMSYINIPSLQEYVLIEQEFVDIEVFRRSNDWHSSHYFLGDTVTFAAINLTLSVQDIYHRVHNEDMVEFLKQQALQ